MASRSSSSRRTAASSGRLQKDGVQNEVAVVRRPCLLMAASSGDWEQLLDEVLGKEEGVAVASLLARDIVVIDVDIASGGEDGSRVATEWAGSALHVVAATGDSERYLQSARLICCRAQHLLAAPDGNSDTPLHCAIRAGNKGMVARLIELAAEGDEEHGGGCCEKVRDLLRMQNARGETALHEADRFGDKDMVQLLLKKDRELARVVAKDVTSPLYLACSLGHGKIIAAKLHDADDEQSYSGPNSRNALHAAALHDKGIGEGFVLAGRGMKVQLDCFPNWLEFVDVNFLLEGLVRATLQLSALSL